MHLCIISYSEFLLAPNLLHRLNTFFSNFGLIHIKIIWSYFKVEVQMIMWVTGLFAGGSFRPGSIRPWVLSPQSGGSFRPYFIQALWIEVRYALVYKGVEGAMGSRCAFSY